MRIMHVNKFLYRRGGAEAYALDVADLQREQGHEVQLWGMSHPDNLPQDLEDTFATCVEFDPPPPSARARARLFARMVHASGAEQGMTQALERFRPDIVHLHNIYHQLSPSVLKPLRAAAVPAVMTLHDYKLACPTYQLLDGSGSPCTACVGGSLGNAVRRRCGGSRGAAAAAAIELGLHRRWDAYGHINTFLCPSNFLRDVMCRAGVYPDRMTTFNNFVDPRGMPRRSQPRRSVTYIGRLGHEKAVDVLIKAVAHLADDIEVDIVGTGPEEPALRRLASALPPSRITWHGRLDRAQVGRVLSRSGVCVVPSRWFENQPVVVLEAFACGVPVVGTALGGLIELIDPGVTGDLVAPDDPAALARGIAGVLEDMDRNRIMGDAARARATAHHAPAQHLENLFGHYENAVGALATLRRQPFR